MNIFAGVARGTMAELDLSDTYLKSVRVFGHSASTIADLRLMLQQAETGELSPNRSVAAIGSLNAARDGLQAVKDTGLPRQGRHLPAHQGIPADGAARLERQTADRLRQAQGRARVDGRSRTGVPPDHVGGLNANEQATAGSHRAGHRRRAGSGPGHLPCAWPKKARIVVVADLNEETAKATASRDHSQHRSQGARSQGGRDRRSAGRGHGKSRPSPSSGDSTWWSRMRAFSSPKK